MKKIYIVFISIMTVVMLFTGCFSSRSSKRSSSYSDAYNSDSTYKKNVDDIAKTWGTSSEEVDRKLNAVADSLK